MIPVVAFHKSLERHKKIVQEVFDMVRVRKPKNLVIVLQWHKSRKEQYSGYIWEHGDKRPYPEILQRFLPKYTYAIVLYLPKTPKKLRVGYLPYFLAHEYRHWEQMNLMDKVPRCYEKDAREWAIHRVFCEKKEDIENLVYEYESENV